MGLSIAGTHNILAAQLLTVVVRLSAAIISLAFLVVVVEDGVSWIGYFLQGPSRAMYVSLISLIEIGQTVLSLESLC